MQFFPAMQTNGVNASRANGTFEFMETRPGQEFSGLLSAHLDQADANPSSWTAQVPSQAGPEPVATEVPPYGEQCREEELYSSFQVEEGTVQESEDHMRHAADDIETRAAKPAVPEDSASHQGHESQSISTTADQEHHVPVDHAGTEQSELSDDAVCATLEEVLAGVSEQANTQGGAIGGATIEGRIEALRELLHKFQQSDPSVRSELAVALGAQIRGLKEDLLAAVQKEKEAGQASEQRTANASRFVSRAIRQLEDVSNRIAKSGKSMQVVTTKSGSESRAASIKTEVGDVAGAINSLGGQKVRIQGNQHESSVHKDEVTTGQNGNAKPTRKTVAASNAVQTESQPRSTGQKDLRARELAQSENVPTESAVSGTDKKHAVGQDGQPTEPKKASDAATGLAAVIGGKNTVAKEKPEQQMGQELGAERQDEGHASQVTLESADAKGNRNHRDGNGAKEGFFGAPGQEKTSPSKLHAAASGKSVLEGESLTQTVAQSSQTSAQSRLDSPVTARNAEVYKQVENGAFKNLGQGIKQLVIRLDPMEMGQVSVILQVRGKEVQAVLRTSNPETSQALSEQMSQLRTQLEAQGLKVGKLEVQTQLADSQSQSQWQGTENHNRYQENLELAQSAQRWRSFGRVEPDMVRDVQNTPQREKFSPSGLDIFA